MGDEVRRDNERTAMQPDPYHRFWQQLEEINRQQHKTFVAWPPEAVDGSGVAPEYVYEAGKVLCRTVHVDEVVRRLPVTALDHEEVTAELTLITLPEGESAPHRVREVNAAGAIGGLRAGSLNHLVGISPVNICPADEPVPVAKDAPPWPPRAADDRAGAGVTILVVDTGMIYGYLDGHPWLAGVSEPPPGEQSHFYRTSSFDPDSGFIMEYHGHGAFVSGVLGCVAPSATIRVHNALELGGALDEAHLGAILLAVLRKEGWPDLISLSAGAPTQDGLPLMGLEGFLAELAAHEGTLLVAAAGNDAERDDAEDRPGLVPYRVPYHFWPAAHAPHHDGIISVGALARRHDGRACFTNHGSSVTVYARGEEHVNAFLSGEYEYHHGTDPRCHNYPDAPLYCPCSCVTSLPYHGHGMFQGMARWSGTSFATPLVAGMVAVHMRETGQPNARLAVRDLIDKKAHPVTDVDGEPLLAFR
jgi:subtilisin family serine protease